MPVTPVPLDRYQAAAAQLDDSVTLRFKTGGRGIAINYWERSLVRVIDFFSPANTVAARKRAVLDAFFARVQEKHRSFCAQAIWPDNAIPKKLSSRTVNEVTAWISQQSKNEASPVHGYSDNDTERLDIGTLTVVRDKREHKTKTESTGKRVPDMQPDFIAVIQGKKMPAIAPEPASIQPLVADTSPKVPPEADLEIGPQNRPEIQADPKTAAEPSPEVPPETPTQPKVPAGAPSNVVPEGAPKTAQEDAPEHNAYVIADIEPRAAPEADPEIGAEARPDVRSQSRPEVRPRVPPTARNTVQIDVLPDAQPKAQTDLPPADRREAEPDLLADAPPGLQPPTEKNAGGEAIPGTPNEAPPIPAPGSDTDPVPATGPVSARRPRQFRPATVQRSRSQGLSAETEIAYATRLSSGEIASLRQFAADLLPYVRQNEVANQVLWGPAFKRQLLSFLTALTGANAGQRLDLNAMTLEGKAIRQDVLQTLQAVALRLGDKPRPAAQQQATVLVAPIIRAELNRRTREHFDEQHPLQDALAPSLRKRPETAPASGVPEDALIDALGKVESLRARQKATMLTLPDMQSLRQQLITQAVDHLAAVEMTLGLSLQEGADKTGVIDACLALDKNASYARAREFAHALDSLTRTPEATADKLLALLDAGQGPSSSERHLGLLLFTANAAPASLTRLSEVLDTQAEALTHAAQTLLQQGQREFLLTNLRDDFRRLADTTDDR